MGKFLFVYVVARDFGFAPNPYHGFCTLATCVPRIRSSARIGDWVMGVGGSRLKATGKIIYLMRVSEVLTFDEYWADARFLRKRPMRNGSLVMMVGDNVYHREVGDGQWIQADSHHSSPDGTPNHMNLKTDTSSESVLISNHFFYFGKSAPAFDLETFGYKNHRGHSKKSLSDKNVDDFIRNFEEHHRREMNLVLDDPFDFSAASKRVDQATGRIS